MNNLDSPACPITVDPNRFLYKWNRSYGSLQRKYFEEPVIYRREKQIEDFILLNDFQRVQFETETDILHNVKSQRGVKSNPDLTVIATQKFSRHPPQALLEQIGKQLDCCPRLYLCLMRWYINIDNSYCDPTLSDDYVTAITQWLRRGLPRARVLDLGINTQENGNFFSWVIPDRHFYIELNDTKGN